MTQRAVNTTDPRTASSISLASRLPFELHTLRLTQRLRSENAGSFIRPTSHLVYGVSFLTALTSKYVEALHGSHTQETVVLGSSQGTIEVEAVSLDKIRQKFARLDQLREISLEHANVVKGDEPGRIYESCPSMLSIHITLICTSFNLFR